MAKRRGLLGTSRRESRILRYAVTFDCQIPRTMPLRKALLALDMLSPEPAGDENSSC
jgi:hypothetical protein